MSKDMTLSIVVFALVGILVFVMLWAMCGVLGAVERTRSFVHRVRVIPPWGSIAHPEPPDGMLADPAGIHPLSLVRA
jgi:hypothetical protein